MWDPTATLIINTASATSGVATSPIALSVGANTITTVVTAGNGVASKTYVITVTRAAPPVHGNYLPISVSKPVADNLMLAEDGVQVHEGLSPNGDGVNDYLKIENIKSYLDNKLTITSRDGALVYVANGYDNATKVFDGHNSKTGQMQLPGTYFYSLDFTVAGEVKHKSGFIVLKY